MWQTSQCGQGREASCTCCCSFFPIQVIMTGKSHTQSCLGSGAANAAHKGLAVRAASTELLCKAVQLLQKVCLTQASQAQPHMRYI